MALVNWSEAEKEAFLQMQFTAQHRYYHDHFREARFDIVELNGCPIGRLYVDRRSQEVRIIDIAILPEFRNRGLGSLLLNDLLVEAARSGNPIRIHVELNNPAMRLYERLGFVAIADQGLHRLMEWNVKGTKRSEA